MTMKMTITVMMIKILRVIWTLHYIWLNLCEHGFSECLQGPQLSTKNFALPTRGTGLLPAPPPPPPLVTQQTPDSAGSGKVNTRCQSKPLVNTALYKGMCQNSPLPTPLVLPSILSHPSTFRAVPGSTRAVKDAKPSTFLETAVAQSQSAHGTKRKPSDHVLRNSDR